jgi:hypothetical protein
MNAFSECRKIELAGMRELEIFFGEQSDNGRFVLTNKGRLSKFLQETVGDVLINNGDKIWGVEVKVEKENKFGNFFVEYWSNLSRFNPGWVLKLKTDILLYYFFDSKELYSISFNKLREWAFCKPSKKIFNNGREYVGRIYDFELKPQKKYDQKNDTWGRCVPISIIEKEVGFKKYNLRNDSFREEKPQQKDNLIQQDLF